MTCEDFEVLLEDLLIILLLSPIWVIVGAVIYAIVS